LSRLAPGSEDHGERVGSLPIPLHLRFGFLILLALVSVLALACFAMRAAHEVVQANPGLLAG